MNRVMIHCEQCKKVVATFSNGITLKMLFSITRIEIPNACHEIYGS